MIGDVYNITNEGGLANQAVNRYAAQTVAPKTFMYEFSKTGTLFTLDDLDIILCNRLMKQKDENKFIYLFEAYERLENHIWAKRKGNDAKITEMKNITARYFVTCLSCPDTFDLSNEMQSVPDKDHSSGGGDQM